MNPLTRFKAAPNIVTETKLNIFAPYEKKNIKVSENHVIFENDEFKVSINGYMLNQIHRDILDIALYYGDSKLESQVDDSRPVRLFSLYDIQRHLNYKSKNQHLWLDRKFKEMKRTTINIQSKTDESWIEFNIIDIASYSQKQSKYALVISELYMNFFDTQISVNYKSYLPIILSLSAQTKAAVRYLLSHSNDFQIDLELLMEKIGIQKNSISHFSFTKNKNKILDDEEKLKALNITFKKQSTDKRKQDYTVQYRMLSKIQVFHP